MELYDKELEYLRKVLKRSRIDCNISENSQSSALLASLNIDILEERTIYLVEMPFHMHFILLQLPGQTSRTLTIGPYMTEVPTDKEIEDTAAALSMVRNEVSALTSLFPDLMKVSEASLLLHMALALAEAIWPGGNTRAVILKSSDIDISRSLGILSGTNSEEGFDEYRKDMMLQRYESENRLIGFVTAGNVEAAKQIASGFSAADFDKRSLNPVYNSRNYGVILNTLMRKAAEAGGVHPIYIDKLSTSFAYKLDGAATSEGVIQVMKQIPAAYAELVRDHSYTGYTEPIKSVLVRIDTAIATKLSLEELAEISNLSPSRLSARFSAEVGMSISEYIAKARLNEACHLLEKGASIEETAQKCGFSDVHYFSHFFKKKSGYTPGKYAMAKRR